MPEPPLCSSCQGRRWVGDPSNPQECSCVQGLRPVPVQAGMPASRLTSIQGVEDRVRNRAPGYDIIPAQEVPVAVEMSFQVNSRELTDPKVWRENFEKAYHARRPSRFDREDPI
jgi:hypothetical protein